MQVRVLPKQQHGVDDGGKVIFNHTSHLLLNGETASAGGQIEACLSGPRSAHSLYSKGP
jgi:hypothetical protein